MERREVGLGGDPPVVAVPERDRLLEAADGRGVPPAPRVHDRGVLQDDRVVRRHGACPLDPLRRPCLRSETGLRSRAEVEGSHVRRVVREAPFRALHATVAGARGTSTVVGQKMGRQIGELAVQNYLRPVR